MSRETELDKLTEAAIRLHEERRSKMFAEEAAAYLAQVYGGHDAALILRGLAQHLEDFG